VETENPIGGYGKAVSHVLFTYGFRKKIK
jgi:hypothetical protein